MLPLPIFNLEPERQWIPHSCSENVSALFQIQVTFEILTPIIVCVFGSKWQTIEWRYLLVGNPHADVRSTHKRGGRVGGMSHTVL